MFSPPQEMVFPSLPLYHICPTISAWTDCARRRAAQPLYGGGSLPSAGGPGEFTRVWVGCQQSLLRWESGKPVTPHLCATGAAPKPPTGRAKEKMHKTPK